MGLAPERWTSDPEELYSFPSKGYVIVDADDREIDGWDEEEDGPRNDDWIHEAYMRQAEYKELYNNDNDTYITFSGR